jgi:DnaJ-class molecular chaperone
MDKARINYAPETCARCVGIGHNSGRCSACNGQGSVLVAQPARQCAWCCGTGHNSGRCPVCGGTGWAHVLRPESPE